MIRRGWRYLCGYRERDVRVIRLVDDPDEAVHLADFTGASPGVTARVPSTTVHVKAARFGEVWKR